MPTAPTINSITDAGGYLLISYSNSGTGDHNQLWRVAADEYGGLSVKIADPVPWNTTTAYFRDYEAASGKTYTYLMVAVDVSGNTAASTTKSASLMLSSAWIHSMGIVDVSDSTGFLLAEDGGGILLEDGGSLELEGSVTANAVEALQLNDMSPHTRSYELASAARVVGSSSLPLIGVGSIEKLQVSLPVIIVYGNSNRTTLRSIYTSPYYACLRDILGNKWLGRLLPVAERYVAAFTEIGFTFETLDVNEAVA